MAAATSFEPTVGMHVVTRNGRVGIVEEIGTLPSRSSGSPIVKSVSIRFTLDGPVSKYSPDALRKATRLEARDAGWDVPLKKREDGVA